MQEIQEIIGVGLNLKNGIVISSDKDYFVKNVEKWNSKFFNKEVKATGKITVTQNNSVLPPTDDGIIKQGIPTHSWEEYQTVNTQYWIEINSITLVE